VTLINLAENHPTLHSTLLLTLQYTTMDNNDDFVDDLIIQASIEAIRTVVESFPQQSEPVRSTETMLSGHDYVQELLLYGSRTRILQVLRMELSTFWSLRDWLVAHTPLRNSRIQVEEKLLIFLFIVTRPASNRDAQERFAVGPGTVSR
jgi:hypothetical protein